MGKKITITESKLNEIIKRAINEAINHIMNEGIDVDYQNRVVSYNPTHQNNVDTSIENNPSYSGEYAEDVLVWSILKRKGGSSLGDGNPLIYAMKGEQKWRFRSDEDYKEIVKQVNLIVEKFAKSFSSGISILLPSTSHVNTWLSEIISSKIPTTTMLIDVFMKITTTDAWNIITDPSSKFMQYYKLPESNEEALKTLKRFLNDMNTQRNGYFTRHFIKEPKMRNLIDLSFKLSDDAYSRYANVINGQDVLLIDDSISRGDSIKNAINIIRDTYNPKSISVLTLFSKKY